MVSGFKHTAVISHFISIVMTSTPPQITRHSTPEVGDPCPTVESLIFHFFKKEKGKGAWSHLLKVIFGGKESRKSFG